MPSGRSRDADNKWDKERIPDPKRRHRRALVNKKLLDGSGVGRGKKKQEARRSQHSEHGLKVLQSAGTHSLPQRDFKYQGDGSRQNREIDRHDQSDRYRGKAEPAG